MRIPIFVKLITLIFLFLIGTIFFFSQRTVGEFTTLLTLKEETANTNEAQSKLKETEFTVQNLIDKTSALAMPIAKKLLEQQNPDDNPELRESILLTPDLLSLEILRLGPQQELLQSFLLTNDERLEKNQYPKTFVEDLRRQVPFPVLEVFRNQMEIQNTSLANKFPVLTLGLPLIKDPQTKQVTSIVMANYLLGPVQKIFSQKKDRLIYLVDRRGQLLSHPNEASTLSRISYVGSPLIEKAISNQSLPNFQFEFFDPVEQRQYIGAYAKSPMGFISVSQIEKEKVLEPARQVRNEAVRIAGQVLALAFFISFLFSLTLTQPLETLSELIQKVSTGNFGIRAQVFVRSSDEVGDLAKNFDQMTVGLRERDKMKSLFNKFHGSSIAEALLKKEIGVGGTNQEVTIFFSDIRGFTSFSEKHTPEQVVEMLNEYFSVMVGIINKHHGVVDKFIGDAIMAVWGVPKNSPEDTRHALRACLEMRQALEALNNRRREKNQPPILIGMGLHSGLAISGTIGSQERMEYTVIGDTVNLASRIEASTKSFGTDFLVSDEVVKKGGDQFRFDLAGEVSAKGKEKPLQLHRVLAIKKENGDWREITTIYSSYEAEKSEKIKTAA